MTDTPNVNTPDTPEAPEVTEALDTEAIAELREQLTVAAGYPAAAAAYVKGTTAREIAADLESLAGLFALRADVPPVAQGFDGGCRAVPEPEPDMNQLLRRAAGRV